MFLLSSAGRRRVAPLGLRRIQLQLAQIGFVGSGYFGIRDDVKHSSDTVRRAAGLGDLRFHDLRHTAATRLVGLHIPLSEVGRVLGHTQANTTYRYVNANIETARRASAALDAFNAEDETLQASESVN